MTLRLFTGKDTIEIEDYSGELEMDEYSITEEQMDAGMDKIAAEVDRRPMRVAKDMTAPDANVS